MKLILAAILALSLCACDSIDQAQKRNTTELPSNPDATEQVKETAPKPTPDLTSRPAAEYEAEREK